MQRVCARTAKRSSKCALKQKQHCTVAQTTHSKGKVHCQCRYCTASKNKTTPINQTTPMSKTKTTSKDTPIKKTTPMKKATPMKSKPMKIKPKTRFQKSIKQSECNQKMGDHI